MQNELSKHNAELECITLYLTVFLIPIKHIKFITAVIIYVLF